MEIQLTSQEMKELLHPKNSVKLLTGLAALFFDRYGTPDNGHQADGNGQAETIGKTAVAPDDLTLINGIGPTIAKRLHAAGIFSFTDLAAQTPEQLRTMAQIAEWQGDPTGWIAQARARL